MKGGGGGAGGREAEQSFNELCDAGVKMRSPRLEESQWNKQHPGVERAGCWSGERHSERRRESGREMERD